MPGAPVLRAAPNGETQIDLSWDEPATNGADITRYELQESDDGNPPWNGLGGQISASTTSYDHTGLSAGTKKYYQIRAYNSQGFGPWRAASATTQSGVPDKPVLSAAANGETEIDLTWAAPADNGEDITRYELQVSDDGTSGWSGLGGRISASVISYTHKNLSPGTRSTTRYGRITRQAQAHGPMSQGRDHGNGRAGQAGVERDGERQDDRSTSPGVNQRITARPSTATNCKNPTTATAGRTSRPSRPLRPERTITPLFRPGRGSTTRYGRATSEGPGAWSDPKNATTQADVPDKPVLTATEPNGQRKIDLTWDAPPDNGASISRYELQVSDDGNSWTNLATNIGSSARSYSSLQSFARDPRSTTGSGRATPQGPSEWSDPKDATTPVGAPDAPVLRATANGQTIIDLSWDEPANNGMDITSYELEVSDDGNSWTPLNSSLHLLRQIVQSHRSFARDEEVLPDTSAQLGRSRRVVEPQERDYRTKRRQ